MTAWPEHPPSASDPDKAAEGALLRVWGKEGTRILLVVIGALGAYAWDQLSGDVAGFKAQQVEQGRDITQIKSDVRDVNTRLDAGVIRDVRLNTTRGEDHERRIQQLERITRVP